VTIGTFVDERMKILYTHSFMHGGMAPVWAANETNVVLSGMSSIRAAYSQLHMLKMMAGPILAEYTRFRNSLKMHQDLLVHGNSDPIPKLFMGHLSSVS